MRIRTKLELKDELDKDLGWRKRELTLIRTNVNTSEAKVLDFTLRTSVLLLYAHWEGFIKNAGEVYVNFVSNQSLNLDQLSDNFLAVALKQKIATFSDTKKSTIHCEFVTFFKTSLGQPATIASTNVISANSNLNSKVLEQILITVGIDYSPFELKANIIDERLLKLRNTIAHGERLKIDRNDYLVIHQEIFDMITQIKTAIENDVALGKFRK